MVFNPFPPHFVPNPGALRKDAPHEDSDSNHLNQDEGDDPEVEEEGQSAYMPIQVEGMNPFPPHFVRV